MKKLSSYLLLVITILSANKLKAQVDVNDSLALVDLYNSTNGPHWITQANWLTGEPVAKWHGIILSGKRVYSIHLYYNNLEGTLPASLGNLTDLRYLSLEFNQLSGSIPPEIGKLTHLVEILLNNNKLSGSFLPGIGNLIELTGLYLSNNQLSGNIPVELSNCVSLVYIRLSANQLTGSIPAGLGKLHLKQLFLDNNKLSGNIPLELGNCKNLNYLYLDHNQLSGKIPDVSGLKKLRYLSLNNNQLSGKIPTLAALGYLQTLYLNNNRLTGSIPGTGMNIKHIRLDSNQLTGIIPADLGNNLKLIELSLKSNKLSGNIPSELGNLIKLEYLDLSQNNNLSGPVPASFSKLKNLKKLSLNHDRLDGTVPVFLSTLHILDSLEILFNYFNFDGIETLAQHNFKWFKYGVQRKINIHKKNNRLSIYAGGTLSNNTYKWYKNGSLVATVTGDSTFKPTESGSYNVQVTNSIATELTLHSDAVTFNTLTDVEQNDIALSQAFNKNSFYIYPNPAKTSTTVIFYLKGNYILKLTDANGNVLQTKKGVGIKSKNTLQIDVSKYATGIYFVTISNDKNQQQTLEVNKE